MPGIDVTCRRFEFISDGYAATEKAPGDDRENPHRIQYRSRVEINCTPTETALHLITFTVI